MHMDERRLRDEIRRAVNASRTRLPAIAEVAIRSNVHRLASTSRRKGGLTVLNLARAVADAGEEAWTMVAPALEGDAESRRRLRLLARAHVSGERPLPSTPCHGTLTQREYLLELVAFLREGAGVKELFPPQLQLRISASMTSALGSCLKRGDSHRITISERLFRVGLEPILWDTVKHEVAHLLDQTTSPSGRSSHGPRWREWAIRLGARPERRCAAKETVCISRARRARGGDVLLFPPEVEAWRRHRVLPGLAREHTGG